MPEEMRQLDFSDRIIRDPGVCSGVPVFRGTRVPLRTVLASIAGGAEVEEILEQFPSLRAEDVVAAIAFAATSVLEDLPNSLPPAEG
jgi:uncharacterized protein (DUF433 family)